MAKAEAMKKGWADNKDGCMAEITELFNASATSEDKLLNEAMCLDMGKKMEAAYDAKGWLAISSSDEMLKKNFEIMNKITPGVDGVSLMDIWNFMS